MRLGALNGLIAAFLRVIILLPTLRSNFRLGEAGHGVVGVRRAAKNEVEMECNKTLRMGHCHAGRNGRAIIAALRNVAVIAQQFHQLQIDLRRLGHVEALVPGWPGKAIARDRGGNDMEGIPPITAMAGRVGQGAE